MLNGNGSCTKAAALEVLEGAAGASDEIELERVLELEPEKGTPPPKTKPPEIPLLGWDCAVQENPVVAVVVAGTVDRGAGAVTPKMNGEGVVDALLVHPNPALATAEGRGVADETDAVVGPGPSQAAHVLSLLGLRTLHTLHFHDSAGSVWELGGTAHAVLDHIPLFGPKLSAGS
jgi:hypothetical protein